MTKTAIAAATVVAALAASASPAAASDASLRAGIKAADQATTPDAKAFAQAALQFAQDKQPGPVIDAAHKLITDINNERKLIAAQKTSTAKVRKGKSLYLASLKGLKSGLQAFDKVLTAIQSGKKPKAATLKKAEKRIDAAQASGRVAEKLIGIKES